MITWTDVDDFKMQTIVSDPLPIDPNTAYQLSGWFCMYRMTSDVAHLGLTYRDGKGKEIGFAKQNLLRIPTWQYPQLFFGPNTGHPFPPGTASVTVVIGALSRVDFSQLSFAAD